MTKVYVVTYYIRQEYDDGLDDIILGVYSDEDLALKEIRNFEKNPPKKYNHYYIREIEIDKIVKYG